MKLKYFDDYNGIWKDVEALQGESLVFDVSGFTAVNQKPYKVFIALLSQTSTYPVVNVLQDEIGYDGSNYDATGQYELVFTNTFNKSLTSILIGSCNSISHNKGLTEAFVNNDDNIGVVTYDDGYNLSDDILYNTTIEIKVYE